MPAASPDAEPLLAELVLMLRRVGEDWDERTRKEVFAASDQRARGEADLRAAAPPSHQRALRRAPPMRRRYLAYGSNLCPDQMRQRCQ